MPIQNYSVLKGDPASGELVFNRSGRNPHYRIYISGGNGPAQIDVNVESQDGSEVLYFINNTFTPPSEGALQDLALGTTRLDRTPGGLALDYVRERLAGSFMVDRGEMQLLPSPDPNASEQQNDLKNAVINLLDRAVKDPEGIVYAFGSAFTDANGTAGIHNIHMNQGNPPGPFDSENGVWQDGALFINLPAENPQERWVALFIAFQTQSWETDNHGNPQIADGGTRATSAPVPPL